MPEKIDAALRRRIVAAASAATVNRTEVDLAWPECHKAKCSHQHPAAEDGFALMQHAVVEAIDLELGFSATTRPDMADEGDSPEDVAVYTLARLLNTYNVHHAGTFVRAARLMVEAYPALAAALGEVAEA